MSKRKHKSGMGESETATGSAILAGDLDSYQSNEIVAMSNVVRRDLYNALIGQGVKDRDAEIAADRYKREIGSLNIGDPIPGLVTAVVDVSKEASPSGTAKARFRIGFEFGEDFKGRPRAYKGISLTLGGVEAY